MARKDDYENALKIAAEQVALKDPMETAKLASVEYDEDEKVFRFDFMGRAVEAGHREGRVRYIDADKEADLPEKVLVYHYLHQAKGVPLTGEDVDYREIPGGEFYYSAFNSRAQIPLLKTFGEKPELLEELAPQLGGETISGPGDASARFKPMPMVQITYIVWGGDDEFEPSAKILFDRNVKHYLTTEDAAWAASMIVYKMMGLAARK